MKYTKSYAKQIFDLLPQANYLAVDSNGSLHWFDIAPYADEHINHWKPYNCGLKFESGYLGKVSYFGRWQDTLVTREDL